MISIEKYKNVVSLYLSEEADTGSGGDHPARNILTDWNGQGRIQFPQSIFPFQSFMPKKTHCFGRSKREKITIINTKKGQHILGQDIQRTAILSETEQRRKPKIL